MQTMQATAGKSSAIQKKNIESPSLPKAPTGIQGLDEITNGGFPRGRPTLVCGSAGAGKTLLAMEFLVRGATQFNEPGVFMAFEETAAELTPTGALAHRGAIGGVTIGGAAVPARRKISAASRI